MSDNWSGQGYDAPASQGSGIYLRLKHKDEKVRLRLVSDPYRYIDTFKDGDEQKMVQKASWLAIHKYMENGKPTRKVVVFQAGPMIYGLVKDLAENPEWGDPRLFDIEVTRTEQAGKYYTVAALPKGIGPISTDEEKLVKDANLDLVKLCTREGSFPVVTAAPADDYDEFENE